MKSESVVFQSGNTLAVRLTGDCRLKKGTRVREYRDASRVIIEPLDSWPDSFIAALGSFAGDIPRPSSLPAQSPFERGRKRRSKTRS